MRRWQKRVENCNREGQTSLFLCYSIRVNQGRTQLFILVNFGTSDHGLWNMKRFNYPTIAEAVEAGEATTKEENGEGFVVISSYYDAGKNDDEAKVVYKENAETVEVQTFPYICVKVKK